jgi:hypothetical protein
MICLHLQIVLAKKVNFFQWNLYHAKCALVNVKLAHKFLLIVLPVGPKIEIYQFAHVNKDFISLGQETISSQNVWSFLWVNKIKPIIR